MINATDAAAITTTWQALENSFGGRAVTYMRTALEPAIEASAKCGQSSVAQQGVSTEFLQELTAALQSLGYVANLSGSTFTVSW